MTAWGLHLIDWRLTFDSCSKRRRSGPLGVQKSHSPLLLGAN